MHGRKKHNADDAVVKRNHRSEPVLGDDTPVTVTAPELVPVYGRDDVKYGDLTDNETGIVYPMTKTKPKQALLPKRYAHWLVQASPMCYSLNPFASYTGLEKASEESLIVELSKRGYDAVKRA
jgi:hypothetical protein